MSAVLYVQKRSLKQHNPILKHDKLNPLDVFSFQDNLPQKKNSCVEDFAPYNMLLQS